MTATPDSIADWQMDEPSLWHVCTQAHQRRQSDYTRILEAVAELWDRTGRSREDRVALVAEVQTRLRATKRDALRIVDHAELCASEAVRDAARAGELDADRLTVLGDTLKAAPILERDRVEAELLDNTHLHLRGFRMVAQRILILLDQDGPEPKDDLAEPKREFHFSNRPDGSLAFRGILDKESGATLGAMMSPKAKPTPADTRTTAQRQGDAFAGIIELAAGSEDLPDEGGEKPHLAITISLPDLREAAGTGEIEASAPISAEVARRIACDSNAWRMILGSDSVPL